MFTPEEIAEYLKDKEFWQGLWKPKLGDWVWQEEYGVGVIIGTIYGGYRVVFPREGINSIQTIIGKMALIPLFTEGQLLRMLKATGWWLAGLHERPDGSWHVEAGRKFKDYAWAECKSAEGPTPIIALMRALVEVMKDA